MVHQHFMLIPAHTVVENIILGLPGGPILGIRQAAEEIRQRVRQLNDTYFAVVTVEHSYTD